MKIRINPKMINLLLTTSALTIGLTACSPDKTQTSGEIHYNIGEHKLIEVDFGIDWPIGKNGLYGLEAPKGYRVVDFDYDFLEDFTSYSDYFYENTSEVTTNNSNSFGQPVNDIEDNDNLYEAGEHSIVSIDRGINPFGSFGFTKDLEAPAGYDIVDYDYDATNGLDFENITYQNNTLVEVDNFDNFGKPIDEVVKDEKDFYDVGEHTIVMLNRYKNPFFGKDESKTIYAPVGYEIIDYDYDKLNLSEYETILYRNNVPVSKVKNNFGTPLEETKEIDEALVEINRETNILLGKVTLKEASEKEDYYLIDYDYDKNKYFEFETHVYKKGKK